MIIINDNESKEGFKVKKLKFLTVGCLSLILSVTPVWAMDHTFKDVQQSDWYYDAVNFINNKGIIDEVAEDEFAPNEMMTRGTFILSLYHMANNPDVDHKLVFTDVSKEAKYAEAVEWGVENKIISGYSKTLFKPDKPITREEMVTILYNYTQFIGLETPIEGMGIREYVDEQQVSTWARNPMRWGVGSSNIISGVEGQQLKPQAITTRAEASNILMRYCTNVLNSNGSSVIIEEGTQQYALKIGFPNYIAPYVQLDQMEQPIGENETYSLILFKFTKDDHSANIGSLSIYTQKQYDAVKAEGGPFPTEVFRQDGLVVAFMGLQDMPFELQTPEAQLVGNYHQEVGNILKTITLVPIAK